MQGRCDRPSATVKDGSHSESGYVYLLAGSGNYRLSWGMPAKVCQARMDRQCPVCGASDQDVQYDGTIIIAGFETDGKDGICGECGFAFATGDIQVGEPPEETGRDQHRSGKGKGRSKKSDVRRNKKKRTTNSHE